MVTLISYDLINLWDGLPPSIWYCILSSYATIGTFSLYYIYKISIRMCTDMVIVIVMSDIQQYISGRYMVKVRRRFGDRIGLNKKAVRFNPYSPRKSLDGYIGGAMITIILSSSIISANLYLVLIWIISGFFGDLLVSIIKRKIGIKDTSALMPGHGGWLDRVDSLLLPAIITWLLHQTC